MLERGNSQRDQIGRQVDGSQAVATGKRSFADAGDTFGKLHRYQIPAIAKSPSPDYRDGCRHHVGSPLLSGRILDQPGLVPIKQHAIQRTQGRIALPDDDLRQSPAPSKSSVADLHNRVRQLDFRKLSASLESPGANAGQTGILRQNHFHQAVAEGKGFFTDRGQAGRKIDFCQRPAIDKSPFFEDQQPVVQGDRSQAPAICKSLDTNSQNARRQNIGSSFFTPGILHQYRLVPVKKNPVRRTGIIRIFAGYGDRSEIATAGKRSSANLGHSR